MRTAFLLLLGLSACDAGAKPRPPEAEKPTAKASQAKPSTTAFALDYLPADADLVMHLDVAKLRRSKLWADYRKDVATLVMRGFADCAYDPIQEISTITIGIPLETERHVYVIRGLDRDTTIACLRDVEGKKFTFDGELVSYAVSSGTHVVKFVDARTAVIQAKATKQTLIEALQGGAPLADNTDFVAALEAARKNGVADAAFTLVSRPGSTQLVRHMPAVYKMKQLSATARLTDRLDIRYSMTVGSADSATQLMKTMKKELIDPKMMKQTFDRTEVAAQGETITMDVGMTETQLKSVAAMWRGLLPD